MSVADAAATGHEHRLTAKWGPAGVLAIAFVLLALAARGPNTLELDVEVSAWVQQWDGQDGETLAIVGNALGYRNASLAILAIISIGLALLRRPRELWFVCILAVERLAATQVKELFDSPRPAVDEVTVVGVFDAWGFPSGHVMTAAVTLGAIAGAAAGLARRWDLRRPLAIVWLVGVAVAAWARIWYGAHWFTDTVGGAILGAVMVLVASNLSAAITARRATSRQPAPAQTTGP